MAFVKLLTDFSRMVKCWVYVLYGVEENGSVNYHAMKEIAITRKYSTISDALVM